MPQAAAVALEEWYDSAEGKEGRQTEEREERVGQLRRVGDNYMQASEIVSIPLSLPFANKKLNSLTTSHSSLSLVAEPRRAPLVRIRGAPHYYNTA